MIKKKEIEGTTNDIADYSCNLNGQFSRKKDMKNESSFSKLALCVTKKKNKNRRICEMLRMNNVITSKKVPTKKSIPNRKSI